MEARNGIRPAIAGLILASGMSRRFGAENKLLARVHGEPVLRHTVRPYLATGLTPVLVVIGHDAQRVVSTLEGLPIQAVINPDFQQGQSRALVRGVEALPAETQAVVIGVGDQPLLTEFVIETLIDAYHRTRAPIVAPSYAGQPGNPVLFDRRVFSELLATAGDQGGRAVVRAHQETLWIDIEANVNIDVDTQDDLRRAQRWTAT